MSYNILGINLSHNSSVCVLSDGEIVFFLEEERLSKSKHDHLPLFILSKVSSKFKIDEIIISSLNGYLKQTNYLKSLEFAIISFFPNIKIHQIPQSHHLHHISSTFYNSGFKNAIGVVIDGAGSSFFSKNNEFLGQETETIFECSYSNFSKVLFKNLSLYPQVNLSRAYETITLHLGWSRNEAGKTMGLASYGKYNSTFPTFFKNNKGNQDVFYENFENETSNPHQNKTFINEEKNPQLKLFRDPKEWHYNESNITDLEKDLAWKIQNETQQLVGDLIEKGLKETGLKHVCCAGGYFLNCVSNYYFTKRFPGIKFYFEPISSDAGTSIGAAKLLWYDKTKDTTIRPQKTLYYGLKYSKEDLLKGIQKYLA